MSTAVAPSSSAALPGGTKQDVTDGGSVPHDHNLYAYGRVAESRCELDDSLADQYRTEGFLVFANAFQDRVDSLDRAIHRLSTGGNSRFAMAVSDLANSGALPNFTAGARIPWVQYEAGTLVAEKLLEPVTANRIRKLMGFVGYEPDIDAVVRDEKLIQLVACLLECDVDEVELFQDMALLKPANGREKPWHQDKAYFDVGLEERVVGCWIAIDEATPENGCMRMLRGGHLSGPRMHFSVRDYQICDTDTPSVSKGHDVVAVPLPPGGLVLFDGMIPHGTPTNMSTGRRRALQFHWVKRGARRTRESDCGGRAQLFGGAANGLSC